ncbi:MAG: class I SAM-dependent methyltransferase [Gemmiger sp.]|nr:class I SAM-dependent methyltransferase [Gemmiger sp.]
MMGKREEPILKENKNGDNQQFWQRFAGVYGKAMQSSARLYDAIAAKMRRNLNRNMNVLELACGSGQLSFRLAGWVRLWEATDFSPTMIAEAKKQKDSARLYFSVQDATSLPYADNSFDAVLVANALHVMPHPEKALAESRRVLKPGGVLYAPTFIHGNAPGFRLRVRLMSLAGFHTYYKWDEAAFVAFLQANGFQVTEHCVLGSSLAPLCYAAAVVDYKGDKAV